MDCSNQRTISYTLCMYSLHSKWVNTKRILRKRSTQHFPSHVQKHAEDNDVAASRTPFIYLFIKP